jgi:hypothetical protein
MHMVGVTNLIVEMDAQYVHGMLSNPDIQPNAAINRWIAAVLLFNFKRVHVPAEEHQGPDGLSRREPIPGKDDDECDLEEWVDNVLSLSLWLNTWTEHHSAHPSGTVKIFQATEGGVGTPHDELAFPPPLGKVSARESELLETFRFLANGKRLNGQHSSEVDRLHQHARRFFMHNK